MGFFSNFGINEAFGAGASLMNFFQQGKTIEAQKQMQREQNAWNEKMWNLNNEWNSPANQRKLLEEAGYNPAALKDSTATSNSPAQGVNPPNIQAPQLDVQPVISAIQTNLQSKQVNNEQERIHNDYEIGMYDAQTRRIKALSDVEDVNKPNKRNVEKNIERTEQDIQNMKTQNEYQKTVNRFAEARQKAELESAQSWATIQAEAAAVAHDKNQAELAILRITPITQMQQAQAALRAADASMVSAKASERNSLVNQYLAESQRELNITLNKKEQQAALEMIEKVKAAKSYADIVALEAQAKKDLGKNYMKTITVVNDVLGAVGSAVDIGTSIHPATRTTKSIVNSTSESRSTSHVHTYRHD